MPPDPGPTHSFRRQPVHHGRIVRLEPGATTNPTLVFQYNPETVTRSRTGRWEPRKRRRNPDAIETPQQHRGQLGGTGASAVLAESETISFQLTFDATEEILRAGVPAAAGGGTAAGGAPGAGGGTAAGGGGGAGAGGGPPAGATGGGAAAGGTTAAAAGDAASTGVLHQLAFLEMVSLGREDTERQGGRGRATPGREIRPIRPDQLLLELGESRWFPCVITELTITEQRFSPELVPVRAQVDLKLTVLEPVENAYNPLVQQAFSHLLAQRLARSQRLGTTTTTSSLESLLGRRSGG
jgi:hypothetical protein